MSTLRLAFYGDDFTGSTDALEQLEQHGLRTMLFLEPPTPAQLKRFPRLQAVGVAGLTRSMAPAAMARELRPAFKKLKALGAPHVHYKICSTFDSSPAIGNLGCVLDVGTAVFRAPLVPLLVAAPALGRHCVFGTLFARFGIGSAGAIHRLDRHPAISRHPVTPMQEADLRLHLAQQTTRNIELFDILKLALPLPAARAALAELVAGKSTVVLFDALYEEQMGRLGALLDGYASAQRPLFSMGSSGIEMALGAHWNQRRRVPRSARPVSQILVGSGSCSPVTEKQMAWGLKHGMAEVALDAARLASGKRAPAELQRATAAAVEFLRAGRSVLVHTTRSGSDRRLAVALKQQTAPLLGTALGVVLRGALAQVPVPRLCIAGGDTSSFAARAMGLKALALIAPLTPGAPLCRAFAPGSPADGLEVVFKGGQVGAEHYFDMVKHGSI